MADNQQARDASEYLRLTQEARKIHDKLKAFQHEDIRAYVGGKYLNVSDMGAGFSGGHISLEPQTAKKLARWILMILELEEG